MNIGATLVYRRCNPDENPGSPWPYILGIPLTVLISIALVWAWAAV